MKFSTSSIMGIHACAPLTPKIRVSIVETQDVQKSNYYVTLWRSTVSDIKMTLRIWLVSVSINWINCGDEMVVLVRHYR